MLMENESKAQRASREQRGRIGNANAICLHGRSLDTELDWMYHQACVALEMSNAHRRLGVHIGGPPGLLPNILDTNVAMGIGSDRL
ncbi:uncharacterized protein EMH_0088060 [Eimeria mitis]|uniref:Uncharacterized protein n=1 Tax=Eimeria mitis TaxID=44415 RepID=U6KBE5_9EIME|nr:uncharacterized protein EMH_0088060 [Eimeria mitis]CDJ34126.1 hypothetical protein EMH_0088060 [Eimeria mitis]